MKRIRFNLQNNGKSLRTLADLEENLNFDDLFASFQSGEFYEWLIRQDSLCEEHEIELARFKNESSPAALFLMLRNLGVNVSKEDELWFFEREKIRIEHVLQLKKLEQTGINRNNVLKAYFDDYKIAFDGIAQGEVTGYPAVKLALKRLLREFGELFSRDFASFFKLASKNNLWAIVAALGETEAAEKFEKYQKENVAKNLIVKFLRQEGILNEAKISYNSDWQILTDKEAKILAVEESFASRLQLEDIENRKIVIENGHLPDSYHNGIRVKTTGSGIITYAIKHDFIEAVVVKDTHKKWQQLEKDGAAIVLYFEGKLSFMGTQEKPPAVHYFRDDYDNRFSIFNGLQCQTHDYEDAKIYYMRLKDEK